MIKVVNSVTRLFFPVIPPSLSQMSVSSTLALPPDVFKAVASAMQLIDNALKHDPVPDSWLKSSLVIFDCEKLTFEFPGLDNAGYHTSIMFLPVHVWQALRLNSDQMIVCILEEMCHCFWRITDEDLVKDKVLEVVQLLHPDITFEYLYPNLIVNGKRISANDFNG